MNDNLPAYTEQSAKKKLIEMGCSGTVYSLVMPESEATLSYIVDGGFPNPNDPFSAQDMRDKNYLNMYREPWTQRQDSAHAIYFDVWTNWSKPVVSFQPDGFPYRYPTAGASEGIFKLMSEYASSEYSAGRIPTFHMFEGDYEGYSVFAKSLQIEIVRHRRDQLEEVTNNLRGARGQFWLSLPSAIDGMLWEPWDIFVRDMARKAPEIEIIPDLTYVGAVHVEYQIDVDFPNIPAFVFSHSKPMGGYYHRVGGVFAREMRPSLFGNIWFKNLQSLAWGTAMMVNNHVQHLAKKYRGAQEEAARRVGSRLGIELKPAHVLLLATADASQAHTPLLQSLIRGVGDEARIRLCITPEMDGIIRAA